MNILQGHCVLGTKYLVLAFFEAVAARVCRRGIVGNVGESGEDLGSSGRVWIWAFFKASLTKTCELKVFFQNFTTVYYPRMSLCQPGL